MTDTSHAVYVIGAPRTSMIQSRNAKFYYDQIAKQDKWKILQDLEQPRISHASIMLGKNILVVGGKTRTARDHPLIESWNFEIGEAMLVDPSLQNPDSPKTKIYNGIAVFAVNGDFCKK